MCLIVFANEIHPQYRLVLAANRDEFHARPTAPLDEWADAPGVFGGRDLRSGGTWMAVGRGGRWAAVTNFRDPSEFEAGGPSRGQLVADFVRGDEPPGRYLATVRSRDAEFAGYNLLVGTPSESWWTSNRAPQGVAPKRLAPGIYGLSNHLLDTPWPKVVRARASLENLLTTPTIEPAMLLELLLDRTYAAEHELPATGIPSQLERALSAPFIVLPDYGTRSSTALVIARDGAIRITERRYDPDGGIAGESTIEL